MQKLVFLLPRLQLLAALVFVAAAFILMATAVVACWEALREGIGGGTAIGVIEALGHAAVAVVGLQIAQTIIEEEVIRDAQVSAPTRVRRFLSRFLVVICVALAMEALIASFKAMREDMTQLIYAAAFILSIGGLLAGWGAFIKFNRAAEELEPEAMQEAKSEDRKLKPRGG